MRVELEDVDVEFPEGVTEESRAIFLEVLREDIRASLAGCSPLCALCYKGFGPNAVQLRAVYRCADCTLPYHRGCLYAHFAAHGSVKYAGKMARA